ncbi:unnamed protein product, partial [Rotaria magnacalcarata]
MDSGSSVSAWKTDTRDSNKANTAATTTTTSLIKKSSNGLILDETSQAGQSQVKLMPILE